MMCGVVGCTATFRMGEEVCTVCGGVIVLLAPGAANSYMLICALDSVIFPACLGDAYCSV
jgi:hypothetical protein